MGLEEAAGAELDDRRPHTVTTALSGSSGACIQAGISFGQVVERAGMGVERVHRHLAGADRGHHRLEIGAGRVPRRLERHLLPVQFRIAEGDVGVADADEDQRAAARDEGEGAPPSPWRCRSRRRRRRSGRRRSCRSISASAPSPATDRRRRSRSGRRGRRAGASEMSISVTSPPASRAKIAGADADRAGADHQHAVAAGRSRNGGRRARRSPGTRSSRRRGG